MLSVAACAPARSPPAFQVPCRETDFFPAVSAVLAHPLPEPEPGVFQIDADDRFPRLLVPVAQILRRDSAARAAGPFAAVAGSAVVTIETAGTTAAEAAAFGPAAAEFAAVAAAAGIAVVDWPVVVAAVEAADPPSEFAVAVSSSVAGIVVAAAVPARAQTEQAPPAGFVQKTLEAPEGSAWRRLADA